MGVLSKSPFRKSQSGAQLLHQHQSRQSPVREDAPRPNQPLDLAGCTIPSSPSPMGPLFLTVMVPKEAGLCLTGICQDAKRKGFKKSEKRGLGGLCGLPYSLWEERCIVSTPALIEDDGLDKCIYSCKTQSFLACSPSCSKCPTPEAHWAGGWRGREVPESSRARGPDINPIQTSFPKPRKYQSIYISSS